MEEVVGAANANNESDPRSQELVRSRSSTDFKLTHGVQIVEAASSIYFHVDRIRSPSCQLAYEHARVPLFKRRRLGKVTRDCHSDPGARLGGDSLSGSNRRNTDKAKENGDGDYTWDFEGLERLHTVRGRFSPR